VERCVPRRARKKTPVLTHPTFTQDMQLQIEFPDRHMQKYWKDSNYVYNRAEAMERIQGAIRCWTGEKGWHYKISNRIEDHEGKRAQFPIEREWVYVE